MSETSGVKIDRCSPEQLKTLLSLAAGGTGERPPLPAGNLSRDDLRRSLAELCGEGLESGELLLTSVCDGDVPVEALRGIKGLAKKLLAEALNESQRDASSLLYHAAVAAAFGHHGVNLSSQLMETRLALYEDLASVLAHDSLGELFRRAADLIGNSVAAAHNRAVPPHR